MYAILGNHDYWADGVEVSDVVQSFGIQMLGNGWRDIVMNGGRLIIQGCEIPWNKQECEPPVLREGDMLLTLSHTADNIYWLNKAGATAVFSGHYHGGQFQLPVLGPIIVPSYYGRRFFHGRYNVNGTHLFVSAGVGADEPPVRIYCPPDIFIIDFKGI
jgi:predicted MPP superfamily phosphohydrolase